MISRLQTVLTPSRLISQFLAKHDVESARALLEDDEALKQHIFTALPQTRSSIDRLMSGIDVLHAAKSSIGRTILPKTSLYVMAISSNLSESATVRDLLLTIKAMSSEMLASLSTSVLNLSRVQEDEPELFEGLSDIHNELVELIKSADETGYQLQNKRTVAVNIARSTTVSRRAETDKQKLTMSKGDSAYAKLVSRLYDLLKAYFAARFFDIKSMFLYEVFFFDLETAHADSFNPKPRAVIEAALSQPHDYLDCECCQGENTVLSPNQPPTAILYQLYLESGAQINLQDLWLAFYTIIGNDEMDYQQAQYVYSSAYHKPN
jgi:origin recognition complex subunit 3